jgi:hypothetical protein
MPAESYYKRTQFLTRDSDGITAPYADDDIEVRLDSDNSLLDTVETDADGFIDDGHLPSVPDGTVIRLKSPDYAPYITQITGAEVADAYNLNLLASFIVDDNFTDTVEPEIVDIYLEDLDEADVPVQKIGSVAVGGTLTVPYESAYEKNLKIYSVPSGANISGGVTDLTNAQSDDLVFTPDTVVSEILVTETPFEINLEDTNPQIAYTTPTGFNFYPTKYVFHSASDNFTGETEDIEAPGITQAVGVFITADKYIVRVVDVIADRIIAGADLEFQMSGAISKPGKIYADIFGYLRAE